MKNLPFLILISFFTLTLNHTIAQSVGINSDGSTPNSSSILDVKSTDKGLLIPRTDTTSVNTAGTPADGLMIYSPTDKQFYFYTGSRWNAINGELIDRDGDTRIEVEKINDEDKIRMTIGGEEALIIKRSAGGQIIYDMPQNKRNVFLGSTAGSQNGLDSTFVNSAKFNTGIGYSSLRGNTNGLANTSVGASAMTFNTTGNNNSAVGVSAMQSNISGDNNSSFGNGSMFLNTTGNNNVAMGINSLYSNKSGNQSIGIGYRTGLYDTISINNVYVGANAGAGGPTSSFVHDKSNNVMIGTGSGENAQGDDNVFLGYNSGKNESGNNKLYIENSDATASNALIYGEFDTNLLRVNGKLGIGTTGSPSDKLHVVATGSEDLFRLQLNTSTKMRVYNNGSISLGSNNTNISNGDVYVANDLGIGVGIPSNRFHVRGSNDGDFMAKIENTNTGIKSSGLIVEIGPNSNTGSLNHFIAFQDQNGTIVGSVTGDGSGGVQYNTTSDKRLKQNIKIFESGIKTLNKINAHTYEMKSNPGVEHIGFIAQELYEVLPNMVKGTPDSTDKENPMMVDYGKMTPVLVAALKELIEKNTALNKEVAKLKNMNSEISEVKQEMESQRQLLETIKETLAENKSHLTMARK